MNGRRSRSRNDGPTVPGVVAGLFALLTLISLALPIAVLAHGGSGEADGDAALGAGAAVGGAAAAAAASRRQGRPKMFDVKRPGGSRPRRKTPPPATPPPPPEDPPDAGTPRGGGGPGPFGPRGPEDKGPPPNLKDFKQPDSSGDQRTRDGLKGLTGQK